MTEYFDKSPNIAHLGSNFWRKFITRSPSCNFESDNCFLLLLDDDGRLLNCVLLTGDKASCTNIMKTCTALERFFEASALVRIQTQSAYQKDPLGRNTFQTEALYTIADFYNLHLADVVLPRLN